MLVIFDNRGKRSVTTSSIPIFILVLLLVIPTWAGADQAIASGLSALAPTTDDLDVWTPVGKPQQHEGTHLYELINGGAELYHEFGFRRVLAQEYVDPEQRYIALEIYEMESPAAAFGIFTFKASRTGQSIPLGTEAILAGHYLNIWQDRFLLTLSGVEPDDATREGLVEIGQAVADRIVANGSRPELTHLLPVEPLFPLKVWYLAGDLALTNLAPFSGLVPLGFSEGTAADYGGFRLFLLTYGKAELAADRFTHAVDRITSEGHSPLETNRAVIPNGTRFLDGKGGTIHIELIQRFILVTAGTENADNLEIREGLRSSLSSKFDD